MIVVRVLVTTSVSSTIDNREIMDIFVIEQKN